MPTHRHRKIVLIGCGILLVATLGSLLFHQQILRAAGWALVGEDDVSYADVIVVGEWIGEAGALEAADLFREGVAPRVVVLALPTGPARSELARRRIVASQQQAWTTRVVQQLGVPDVVEVASQVSGSNAMRGEMNRLAKDHGFDSIVLIEYPDHSRRLQRILRRGRTAGDPTVFVRVTRYSTFDPDDWWKTRSGLRVGLVELPKLIADIVAHPLS